MCAGMCVRESVCSTSKGRMGVLDPLELEFQEVVSPFQGPPEEQKAHLAAQPSFQLQELL